MAQIILTDSYYTFDASLKTITLASPYDGLSLGQIVAIVDLETNDVLYNSMTQRTDAISISGAVVTHTHGNTGQADTDKLQIIIDDDVSNRNAANAVPSVGTIVEYVQLIDPDGNPHLLHHGHLKVLGYYEGIGHGVTNGDLTIERVLGRNTAIGTGNFTLLEDQPYVQPTGDVEIYIQSSSADDAAAGTGAQQVTIEYFPFAWATDPIIETITLNGLGQVDIGVSDFYRMHKMYTTRGSSSSAGNITITNLAANILYGQISQYTAFMQRCIFYIGTGKKLTCTEGIFGASTSGGVIGRIFASEEDASGNVVSRARIIFEVANSQITYPFQISETVSNPNGKRMAIGLAVAGKVANQTGTGSLKGFVESI